MFFFFFFFDKELTDNLIIQDAFKSVCFNKLIVEGYCDMNPLFDRPKQKRDDIAFKLGKSNSPIESLFSQPYAKSIEEVKRKLMPTLGKMTSNENKVDDYSKFALIYYIFRAIPTYEERCDFSLNMFREWQNDPTTKTYFSGKDIDIRISEGIVFDYNSVDLHIVKSISSYMKVLDTISSGQYKVFFRGHSNINYGLVPSLFRNREWMVNEKKMYQELQINCPEKFASLRNHLECLAEMQHYGLPTRLLDITQNPLVALYFACENAEAHIGEVIMFSISKDSIKYPQSDTVAVLASLPLFSYDTQKQFLSYSLNKSLSLPDFNAKVARLVQEVRIERPGFKDEILPEDIRKSVVVIPSRNNRRIEKQEGAFIICGLLEEIYHDAGKTNSLAELKAKSKDNKKLVCAIMGKEKLLLQLSTLSINKAKVYPEIDDVADYIKNHAEEL